MIPLLDRARDALNAWLAQWWPELTIRYDLDGVPSLTLRRQRKASGLTELVGAGILTVNEARDALGFEAIAGGEPAPN